MNASDQAHVPAARRSTGRAVAREYLAAGDPLGWFDALYARADGDPAIISWADLAPNPNIVGWLDCRQASAPSSRALIVGCGLGDDAEELASRGWSTTAFDISTTAVRWCRRRFPASPVSYVVADLFDAPGEWRGAFDLVVESYTLQVLPPDLRPEAIRRIADFVAPGGRLLVIARGREPTDPEGMMPWPLTRPDLDQFGTLGLTGLSFEDYLDTEEPPVRRFRAVYCRLQSRRTVDGHCMEREE
jgi:SAM-dependent methyltransferase